MESFPGINVSKGRSLLGGPQGKGWDLFGRALYSPFIDRLNHTLMTENRVDETELFAPSPRTRGIIDSSLTIIRLRGLSMNQ